MFAGENCPCPKSKRLANEVKKEMEDEDERVARQVEAELNANPPNSSVKQETAQKPKGIYCYAIPSRIHFKQEIAMMMKIHFLSQTIWSHQ